MKLHIIFTETDILLSKRNYPSWKDIQAEFDDFKASLGPWDAADVADFLADEYSGLSPSAQIQVEAFLSSPADLAAINFQGN
jgi:hypothetical protein